MQIMSTLLSDANQQAYREVFERIDRFVRMSLAKFDDAVSTIIPQLRDPAFDELAQAYVVLGSLMILALSCFWFGWSTTMQFHRFLVGSPARYKRIQKSAKHSHTRKAGIAAEADLSVGLEGARKAEHVEPTGDQYEERSGIAYEHGSMILVQGRDKLSPRSRAPPEIAARSLITTKSALGLATPPDTPTRSDTVAVCTTTAFRAEEAAGTGKNPICPDHTLSGVDNVDKVTIVPHPSAFSRRRGKRVAYRKYIKSGAVQGEITKDGSGTEVKG